MKLYYQPDCPFSRAVRIAAAELGVDDRIDLVEVDPFDPESELHRVYPGAEMPVLVDDKGQPWAGVLYSCRQIERLKGVDILLPLEETVAWRSARLFSLGVAIGRSARAIIRERARATSETTGTWIAWHERTIGNCLATLTEEADLTVEPIQAGHCMLASALSYLNRHFAERRWPERYPRLADWMNEIVHRPSMKRTRFEPNLGADSP